MSIQLHVVVHEGPAGAPVAVCESGLGGDHHSWDRVAPLLTDRMSVVTYDRPGYGSSPARSGPTTLAGLASDLSQVVREHCSGNPYVLVGHSLGGRICRAAAGLVPRDGLRGLVLLEGAFDDVPQAIPSVDRAQRKLLATMSIAGTLGLFRLPPVRARILAKAGFVDAQSAGAQGMLANLNRRAFLTAVRREWATMSDLLESAFTDLPAIELIAEGWKWGDKSKSRHQVSADELLNQIDAHFRVTFPHGEVRRLSGTGHGITMDRPDAVAQAIVDILALDEA